MADRLLITEIYSSIQGESSYAGLPCTFVRLSGCPLRCRWCDTAYSFTGGESLDKLMVLQQIEKLGNKIVEMTGGEPLAQPGCLGLMEDLVGRGYKVLIETSGSESIAGISHDVHIIMDLKCPGSGMEERNDFENLQFLKKTDEIKFVVAGFSDFKWAVDCTRKWDLESRVNILFSPAFGLVKPSDLVEWLLSEKIQARLNLQLHKYIWHPRKKSV